MKPNIYSPPVIIVPRHKKAEPTSTNSSAIDPAFLSPFCHNPTPPVNICRRNKRRNYYISFIEYQRQVAARSLWSCCRIPGKSADT